MAGTNRSGGDRSLSGFDSFPSDGKPVRPAGRSRAFDRKWDELLSQLPGSALRRIDGHQLSILCSLLEQSDELAGLLDCDRDDHKARRLFIQTAQQISRLSSLFGLSIRDRQALKLEPDAPEDDFSKWRSGTTG